MSPVRLSLALVVGFLLSLTSASAQTPATGTALGVVRDSSGGVVPGATVVIRSRERVLERVVQTDARGAFAIDGLPQGTFDLTVVAQGFTPHSAVVDLPMPAAHDVLLTPGAVVEEVRVVSGSRQDELRATLNTRVDVITRARLEETGAESVGEVLRDVPGVLTRRGSESTAPAGQQIQGIDSRQVLVLIDGQPVVGAKGIKRGGALNLDRQSTGRLERVEVVKGAASALYGSDAIGGVINLITRDAGAPLELATNLTGGADGDIHGRGEAGMRRGRWSALFTGERHQHDGFDLTPTTFDTTAASYRRVDAMGKVRAQLNPSLALGGLVNGYTNQSRGNSNGELGPQQDDVRDRSLNTSATLDWAATPLTTVEVRGYAARFSERSTGQLAPPRSTPLEPGALDEDLMKVDISATRVLGSRQVLQGGAEYWSNSYAGDNRIAFEDVTASTGVLWAQHRFSVTDRLTTTVGARVDSHSEFGTAVSPKVAANVRVANGVTARASYGRGFRAPDLGQLYYRFLNPTNFYQVIGNPGLAPEYADSVQLGAEFMSPARRVRFGVNAFHNAVHDLIESVSLGMVTTPAQLEALLASEGLDSSFRPVLGRLLFTYKNINDAATRGVEADGDIAVTSTLSLGGAYTYLQAEDTDTDLALTGRHRHHGHVRSAWRHDASGFRATLRGTFYSSWIAARATSASGVVDTVAPGFMLWDAYASQRLPRGVTAFVAVDNLFASQDPNTGVLTPAGTPAPIYRPDIGRTARFGVRWSWNAR